MVVSDRSCASLRAGARFFGVLFQVLAFLTLAGTLVATFEIAKLNLRIGIIGSQDLLAWIVFTGGLFASCVLAGFGYALGMLCAIFDRQEWTWPKRQLTSTAHPPTPLSTTGITPTLTPLVQPSKATPKPEEPIRVAQAPANAVSPPTTNTSGRSGKSTHWLTRERHFRKPK